MTAVMENLWHGYTLTDLHGIVRWAVTHDYVARTDDMEERADTALCALVEELSACDARPARAHLVEVAKSASSRVVNQSMRHHGVDNRKDTFGQARIEFTRFWTRLPGTPVEDRVVDAVALDQIWTRLTVSQQSAIMALALCDDHAKAADLLGITLTAYKERLNKGRRRFLELWHEGEPPSGLWARDRRRGQRLPGGRLLTRRKAIKRAKDSA